eukprot:scaffold28932_cov143-Skeletonema_menzelii.AAC.1
MRLPKGLYLSPMVRGSDLAMRELARKHGNASLAYSPMLRDRDVISVHQIIFSNKDEPDKQQQQHRCQSFKELKIDKAGRTDSVEEAAYLLHETSSTDTSNLIVQLCGSSPQTLGEATSAVLDIYYKNCATLPFGIDLNLGCPQECAKREGFGAFLVEKDIDATISCMASMRKSIDMYCSRHNSRITYKPTLSAKIRILDGGVDDTIAFSNKLKSVGIDFLAVHCRKRQEKHNGAPDWDAGSEIVAALPDLPIVLNGGVSCYKDYTLVTERTKCHAVMVATGFLSDNLAFNSTVQLEKGSAVAIASQYLDFAEKYPPPSYLYIQKHLRWIFRSSLQPENDPSFSASNWKDWRVKMWSFLVRPYLRSVEQFRGFLALYVQQSGDQNRAPDQILRLVSDVTFGSVKKAGKRTAREM